MHFIAIWWLPGYYSVVIFHSYESVDCVIQIYTAALILMDTVVKVYLLLHSHKLVYCSDMLAADSLMTIKETVMTYGSIKRYTCIGMTQGTCVSKSTGLSPSIDHKLNRIVTAQWEGIGYVGSARYELVLFFPCSTIRVLSYSNCQRSTHSISNQCITPQNWWPVTLCTSKKGPLKIQNTPETVSRNWCFNSFLMMGGNSQVSHRSFYQWSL